MNDSEEIKLLQEKISQLEDELKDTKAELCRTKRKLSQIEEKYEKSDAYNEDLRNEIKKLSCRLHEYRRAELSRDDKITQTDEPEFSVDRDSQSLADVLLSSALVPPVGETDVEPSETQTLAESLKAAAETATHQSGFVYDENYGMYYDYNTGYYYDPKKCLYYDSNSGIYYRFNQSTNEYEYHSQIDLSQYNFYDNASDNQPMETERAHKELKRKKKDKHRDKKLKKCIRKESLLSASDHLVPKEVPKNLKPMSDGTDKFVKEFDSDSEPEEVDTTAAENIEVVTDGLQGNGSRGNSPEESDMEEGELSDSSSSSSEVTSEGDYESEGSSAVHYPPCIRVIVQKSDTLDEGTLFIVTCTGATVGRENNMGHAVLVPDMNVSKMHCSLSYDDEAKKYMLKDHASQNGTFVNSVRISEPKVMSEPWPIQHDDVITIGGTSLLCHIHPGTETCDGCEPGQVQAKLAQQQPARDIVILSREEKEKLRRKELKNIRKKYGLQGDPYLKNEKLPSGGTSYEDKAEERRRTVGSDNPYQRDDAPASVDMAISSTNLGHKMMEKMGWKAGESLGKGDMGIKEPIKVNIRSNQQAGLGSAHTTEHSIDNPQLARKAEKWVKVQKRYQKLQSKSGTNLPAGVFEPMEINQKLKAKGQAWVKGGVENVTFPESEETVKPKVPTKNFEKIFEDLP